jgi:3-dehydroquinate dehydratase-2
MRKIGILNGPNLQLTGTRETSIYGNIGFDKLMEELGAEFDVQLSYFQSNVEGELINKMMHWDGEVDGIILNAGGYTHTSVALGDAIRAIDIPVIEVHLSNIFSREKFRHVSMTGPHCIGVIAGFGLDSYRLAVIELLRILL